jgi:hypothetical protein
MLLRTSSSSSKEDCWSLYEGEVISQEVAPSLLEYHPRRQPEQRPRGRLSVTENVTRFDYDINSGKLFEILYLLLLYWKQG